MEICLTGILFTTTHAELEKGSVQCQVLLEFHRFSSFISLM